MLRFDFILRQVVMTSLVSVGERKKVSLTSISLMNSSGSVVDEESIERAVLIPTETKKELKYSAIR